MERRVMEVTLPALSGSGNEGSRHESNLSEVEKLLKNNRVERCDARDSQSFATRRDRTTRCVVAFQVGKLGKFRVSAFHPHDGRVFSSG